MYRVSAQMKLRAWISKLREESSIRDVMTGLSGTYIGKTKMMPNNVIVDVSSKAAAGVNDVTIGLLMDLSGAGREGQESLLGYEEDQVVKQITLYANTVRHAVPTEQYGIDAWHKSAYKIVGAVQPQLSKWHNEKEGFYMREAFCEKYASNLTKAPISLTKEINSNLFVVAGTTTQVTYDSTLADYVTAIDAAVPTTPTAANQLNIDVLNEISSIASVNLALEPIDRNGKDMYILFIPSNQATLLRDSTDANQLFQLYKTADVRGDGNKAINGELGEYHNLILVEDPRGPRVKVDTTVVFGYKGPGSTDSRGAVGVTEFDVCILSGKAALGKLTLERLMFKEEMQDYESIKGIGAIQTYGYQAMEFDLTTETDSSRTNQNSALFLAASSL